MKNIFTCAFICVGLVVGKIPVSAHDLKGLYTALQSQDAVVVVSNAFSTTSPREQQTRSVLANSLTWDFRSLRVCFFGGVSKARSRIVDAMKKQWQLERITSNRLRFEFGSEPMFNDCKDGSDPFEIRIGFDPSGYWSLTGIESILKGKTTGQSVNFPNWGDEGLLPSSAEITQKVAHEIGHALGLMHENQSPAAPDDCIKKWDTDWVASQLGVDRSKNLTQLRDEVVKEKHEFIFSTYSNTSIMHYYFPPYIFGEKGEKDECFVPQTLVPDDRDILAIQVAYGPSADRINATTRGALPQIMKDERFGPLRALLALKSSLLSR